ncbi:hypothetical protein Rsub_10175 [Raphidocelis subcapitata]|uniref:HMA domain-containing protein n=1 Tax=Raphidocelis subcapitata TaxID=307507 RepID=A0A2V0PCJ2_9CHLO|nr:hypothetical protein Rsub_10175 [Raphidocelis subcapitata]|eukprot:GBF97574.1 hypothetical protein Rsub_10175 [Raphidocelis subcapitata]
MSGPCGPCRAASSEATLDEEMATLELDLRVGGMDSAATARVADALKALGGVRAVRVDLAAEMATVEVDAPSLVDALNMLPGMVKAVRDVGFEAEPHIEYEPWQ